MHGFLFRGKGQARFFLDRQSVTIGTEQKRIAVADFIVQQVTITRENGEVVTAPRITLIDVEGHTFSCVSVGIYNALKTICYIFGMPDQWSEDGLPVIVRQINRGSNRILTLDATV